MTAARAAEDRIAELERQIGIMGTLLNQLLQREARMDHPRETFLAQCVDGGGGYPSSGNVVEIIFQDGTFTRSAGGARSMSPRSSQAQEYAATPSGDLPAENEYVGVMEIDSQYWIVWSGGQDVKFKASSNDTTTNYWDPKVYSPASAMDDYGTDPKVSYYIENDGANEKIHQFVESEQFSGFTTADNRVMGWASGTLTAFAWDQQDIKVKFDSGDPTAGFVIDKFASQDDTPTDPYSDIKYREGAGADENKAQFYLEWPSGTTGDVWTLKAGPTVGWEAPDTANDVYVKFDAGDPTTGYLSVKLASNDETPTDPYTDIKWRESAAGNEAQHYIEWGTSTDGYVWTYDSAGPSVGWEPTSDTDELVGFDAGDGSPGYLSQKISSNDETPTAPYTDCKWREATANEVQVYLEWPAGTDGYVWTYSSTGPTVGWQPPAGAGSDIYVKFSASDSTTNYLNTKLDGEDTPTAPYTLINWYETTDQAQHYFQWPSGSDGYVWTYSSTGPTVGWQPNVDTDELVGFDPADGAPGYLEDKLAGEAVPGNPYTLVNWYEDTNTAQHFLQWPTGSDGYVWTYRSATPSVGWEQPQASNDIYVKFDAGDPTTGYLSQKVANQDETPTAPYTDIKWRESSNKVQSYLEWGTSTDGYVWTYSSTGPTVGWEAPQAATDIYVKFDGSDPATGYLSTKLASNDETPTAPYTDIKWREATNTAQHYIEWGTSTDGYVWTYSSSGPSVGWEPPAGAGTDIYVKFDSGDPATGYLYSKIATRDETPTSPYTDMKWRESAAGNEVQPYMEWGTSSNGYVWTYSSSGPSVGWQAPAASTDIFVKFKSTDPATGYLKDKLDGEVTSPTAPYTLITWYENSYQAQHVLEWPIGNTGDVWTRTSSTTVAWQAPTDLDEKVSLNGGDGADYLDAKLASQDESPASPYSDLKWRTSSDQAQHYLEWGTSTDGYVWTWHSGGPTWNASPDVKVSFDGGDAGGYLSAKLANRNELGPSGPATYIEWREGSGADLSKAEHYLDWGSSTDGWVWTYDSGGPSWQPASASDRWFAIDALDNNPGEWDDKVLGGDTMGVDDLQVYWEDNGSDVTLFLKAADFEQRTVLTGASWNAAQSRMEFTRETIWVPKHSALTQTNIAYTQC